MTLHLVYEKEWVPSTRIRLVQLVPALAARSWPARVVPYPRSHAERRAFESLLAPGDAVLIHRARPTRAEARWWRSLPAPKLYDFDDAIMFGQHTGVRGIVTRLRRGSGFRRMLGCCDGVACGNRFLAEQCDGFAGPVRVVPSAVPADVPQAGAREPGPLRVGWVGRGSNLHYVERIAPALARAAASRELVLVVVSDRPPSLPQLSVEHVPWSLADEARAVATFHVGIMPLVADDPWSRGKCAYKLLQTMAAGVVAIGSDIGMNAELIDHDRNGLLARNPHDWERLLVELADDPERCQRLGRAGRETVLLDYTVDAVADRLVALLDEVTRPPSSSGSKRSSDASTSNAAALSRNASGDGD